MAGSSEAKLREARDHLKEAEKWWELLLSSIAKLSKTLNYHFWFISERVLARVSCAKFRSALLFGEKNKVCGLEFFQNLDWMVQNGVIRFWCWMVNFI